MVFVAVQKADPEFIHTIGRINGIDTSRSSFWSDENTTDSLGASLGTSPKQ